MHPAVLQSLEGVAPDIRVRREEFDAVVDFRAFGRGDVREPQLPRLIEFSLGGDQQRGPLLPASVVLAKWEFDIPDLPLLEWWHADLEFVVGRVTWRNGLG